MEMKDEQIKVKVVAVNKCKHALPLKTWSEIKNDLLKTNIHLWVIIKNGPVRDKRLFLLESAKRDNSWLSW